MRLISLDGEKIWSFIPGQVAILGIEGVGESYFAIASAPEDRGVWSFSSKKGKVFQEPCLELREAIWFKGRVLWVKGSRLTGTMDATSF